MTTFTAAMALMLKYQRMRLTFEETAQELGYTVGTAYNMVSAGTFPIPTKKEGKNRYSDVRDVGAHLDKMRDEAIKEFEAKRIRRAA